MRCVGVHDDDDMSFDTSPKRMIFGYYPVTQIRVAGRYPRQCFIVQGTV